MAGKQEQWLEDLDDLINRIPDIYLPPHVALKVEEYMTQVQEDVTEQIELRSTEWENP